MDFSRPARGWGSSRRPWRSRGCSSATTRSATWPAASSPCGDCESCRLLGTRAAGSDTAARAHPDFHVVTKELARFSDDRSTRERKLITIPFEVLRTSLLEPVYRSAQLGHAKVVIVDEADLIDPRGQNILLKTLEEPPANTYLILVTSSEDKLLPTIRSRCQRVAFLPLPEEIVSRWIGGHAKDWSAAQRRWLVQFAGGSLGRAAMAVQYNLAEWSTLVLPAIEQAAQGRFPAGLGTTIAKCIDEFAKRWVEEHENASKDAANRLAGSLMWTMISQHARGKLAELTAHAPQRRSHHDREQADALARGDRRARRRRVSDRRQRERRARDGPPGFPGCFGR